MAMDYLFWFFSMLIDGKLGYHHLLLGEIKMEGIDSPVCSSMGNLLYHHVSLMEWEWRKRILWQK